LLAIGYSSRRILEHRQFECFGRDRSTDQVDTAECRRRVSRRERKKPQMDASAPANTFYGWRVVAAAFVLAIFGWGLGFYGPPVYLHAVREARGWSVSLISAAVTAHFLIGALVVANLPALYRRYGLPRVTKAGSVALACGIFGWAIAAAPWQLFVATALTGAGWVTMGAAAVNAIIAPWFVRARPAALATAYNGASVGGIILSPLWVALIGWLGFPSAAVIIGLALVGTIWALSDVVFCRTPQQMGQTADGDAAPAASSITAALAKPLPGALLWRDWKFLTLAAGMALGLFAQVGLVAHLLSLLAPGLGAQAAGFALGLATACAIAGRTAVGWLMPVGADRRIVACVSYAVQIVGSLAFLLAAGASVPLLILGVVLFGVGIGNATSLPPLIAQVEFAKEDVARAVPLIVAIAQGSFAFAPALFGLIRDYATPLSEGVAPAVFIAAAAVQAVAIVAFLVGRRAS
jgi:MFS family permease